MPEPHEDTPTDDVSTPVEGVGDRRRVVLVALALVAAQVAFRAWGVSKGWFLVDDFFFMSILMNNPVPQVLFEAYAGHLMPAGLGLTWMNMQLGQLDFFYPGVQLVVMQTVASLGLVVLLVSAFGARRGILPPLALYLSSAITLPAATWWAAGVNQLPYQAVIFWGLAAHLAYLRTRRLRWLVTTLAITLVGLLFMEKVLLVFVLYAFVSLAYFASGDLLQRISQTWRENRWGVIAHGVVALGYATVYVTVGLNFSPSEATGDETPLSEVAGTMIPDFISGITGGPFAWSSPREGFQAPNPSDLHMLLAFAILGLVGYALVKTYTNSRRALTLVGLFLGANVILVAVGRATLVGAEVSQDFRYQTEMAAITAIALALMVLPLRGAVETVHKSATNNFLDRPARVAVATAAVAAMGIYSSVTYIEEWGAATSSRTYFTNVGTQLAAAPEQPVPLVDQGVPKFISPFLSWPIDSTSHMLRMFEDHTRFPTANVDQMYILNDRGEVRPMMVEALRRDESSSEGCPHQASSGSTQVQLDDDVAGFGFWTRLEYTSSQASTMTIEAGDNTHEVEAPAGLHSIFFTSEGNFDTIAVSGVDPAAQMCVLGLELGIPRPVDEVLTSDDD